MLNHLQLAIRGYVAGRFLRHNVPNEPRVRRLLDGIAKHGAAAVPVLVRLLSRSGDRFRSPVISALARTDCPEAISALFDLVDLHHPRVLWFDPSSTVSILQMLMVNGLQKPVRAVALHFPAEAKPLPG